MTGFHPSRQLGRQAGFFEEAVVKRRGEGKSRRFLTASRVHRRTERRVSERSRIWKRNSIASSQPDRYYSTESWPRVVEFLPPWILLLLRLAIPAC